LDTLVPAPDGSLVIAPSTSPENHYFDPVTNKRVRITAGSTYHMSLVRAIFDATDRAAAMLDNDPAMRQRIAAARAKLAPLKLGPDGRILEWAEPYKEAEPGHRHISHLVGLHPFDSITSRNSRSDEGRAQGARHRLATAAAAPAGAARGSSTSSPACGTAMRPATTTSPCCAAAPCRTSSTATRRSRSTATSAPAPADRNAAAKP
jgi:hypothetical protein